MVALRVIVQMYSNKVEDYFSSYDFSSLFLLFCFCIMLYVCSTYCMPLELFFIIFHIQGFSVIYTNGNVMVFIKIVIVRYLNKLFY